MTNVHPCDVNRNCLKDSSSGPPTPPINIIGNSCVPIVLNATGDAVIKALVKLEFKFPTFAGESAPFLF